VTLRARRLLPSLSSCDEMTPIERMLSVLRPMLGNHLAERIRANLPSRKPQLWERLSRALLRRAEVSWRSRFDRSWPSSPAIVSLSQFDVLMELAYENHFIGLPLFVFGVYEISGTRFLQAVLDSGMSVIDVGANSGYYSLIAARLVGSRGCVHAFEPAAGPFERLRRNLALNGFRNVTISRAAVSSGPGRAVVYPSAVKNNDGLGSLLPGSDRSVQGEEVPVITLDHVVEQFPGRRVDLIKVDVEGSEGEVFDGGRALLDSSGAPALLFESFDVHPIIKSLEMFGYEVRHVHYSLRNGLEFPRVGESFDNLFAAYEAPNYVALKPGGPLPTFHEISTRSKGRVPKLLRLLAALA
jgi:FkbM family methyltransferase